VTTCHVREPQNTGNVRGNHVNHLVKLSDQEDFAAQRFYHRQLKMARSKSMDIPVPSGQTKCRRIRHHNDRLARARCLDGRIGLSSYFIIDN